MILYFSATGNCQYVAARLAQADGQPTLSIVDCIRENRYVFADETIGIMSPTYDWGLPNIVREFLEKASFQTEYLYFVATYGTTPGATGYMAQKPYEAAKSARTIPCGCRTRGRRSSTFPPRKRWRSIPKQQKRRSTAFFPRLRHAAPTVIWRDAPRPFSPSGSPSRFMIGKYAEPPICTWRTVASAAGFAPKKCPVQAIEMQSGKPVWVKEKCVMCLGCLHRCPKFAIQYGKNTKKHGQYLHPKGKL